MKFSKIKIKRALSSSSTKEIFAPFLLKSKEEKESNLFFKISSRII